MKLMALLLILSTLTLSVIGCSSRGPSQAASPGELERYVRDHPTAIADDIYDVE